MWTILVFFQLENEEIEKAGSTAKSPKGEHDSSILTRGKRWATTKAEPGHHNATFYAQEFLAFPWNRGK